MEQTRGWDGETWEQKPGDVLLGLSQVYLCHRQTDPEGLGASQNKERCQAEAGIIASLTEHGRGVGVEEVLGRNTVGHMQCVHVFIDENLPITGSITSFSEAV